MTETEQVKQNQTCNNNVNNNNISFLSLFITVWALAGLLAQLTSIACFAYEGSIRDKWIGLLISLLSGPFRPLYWLFYGTVGNNYCTLSKKKKKNTPINKRVVRKT